MCQNSITKTVTFDQLAIKCIYMSAWGRIGLHLFISIDSFLRDIPNPPKCLLAVDLEFYLSDEGITFSFSSIFKADHLNDISETISVYFSL